MASQQRGQQSVSSTTRGWLAALVAALVVTSTLTLGAVAITGGDTGATAGTMGIDEPTDSPSQQQSSISGMMPLADANSTLSGASANDSFGSALAYGDVNGDGVADAIVGAPLNDTANGNNSGAVYVFYGPVNDSNLTAENANLTLLGVQDGDRAGYSVAAGDVNNDSYADVVVGAPLEDAGGDAAGAAYVLYGGDRSGNVSLANANHTFVGEASEDRAGISVATVNRTDGADVLVGAPGNDSTAPNAGAAYVVSGVPEGTTSLANATAKLAGEGANDLAGWSVASAGDFDGDNSTDLVVGARLNDSAASDAGAAYVVTAELTGEMALADATLKLSGLAARDNAGWAVAEAGDVNNDSYSDVVVGAPFNDSVSGGNDAGAAYIAYGSPDREGTISLSEAGTTLLGEGPGDNAGWAVSSAGSGDVTCDEFADVLVGAPNNNSTAVNAGAAYVIAGSENPEAIRNLSTAEAKLAGEAANDSAGLAVSDAGDLTGDGNEDVLVGAPGNDSAGTNAGAAYVVAGACPAEPEPEPTTTTTTTPTTTTTEAPAERPKNVKVAVKCHGEDGTAVLKNQYSEAVDVTITGPDGSKRTVELAPAGSSGDAQTVRGLDDGDYRFRARTADGGERVTVNDRSTLTKTVDCDLEPEPEPSGLIKDVTCDYVKVSASDVDEKKLSIQVRFADGTTTTETVHTDRKGDFSDRIEFDSKDKTVTGVRLFAGSIPMSSKLLDSRSGLSIDCAPEPEPEPEPEGAIVDVTCEDVSVDVENIAQEEVTIQVRFADSTTTTATMDTGSDGDFSGAIAFDNPDDKNVTGVRLFAGDSVDQSQLLDSRTGLNVDCAPEPEPEPEPEGSIVDVTCENVSVDVSNVEQQNVTIQVRFDDSTTTTATVETDEDGDFEGVIPFDNSDDKNVTGVRLFAGESVDQSQLLDTESNLNVDCAPEPEPEPEPAGAIVDVTCENVSVDVSNIAERNVTIQVRFADSTTTTATVETDSEGNFSGAIAFDNSENKTVTGVRLFAGSEATPSQLLDGTGTINVVCQEPEPEPFDPSGEFRADCTEFFVTDFDNATRVVLNFSDGTSADYDVTQQMIDEGQWTFPPIQDQEGKLIVNATLYRNGESVTFESDCEEPQEPFDPTAEFRADCEQFYVSDHDNATRVVLNFTDGSSQEFDDIPSDRGEWSYLGSGDNEGKQIDNATIYRNGQSANYEADCPTEPEPEPSGAIIDVTCENVTVEASNVAAGNVTIQVRFDDSTTTTATVETDGEGNFSGAIEFDNSENKNVTGVRLFAGTEPASSQQLDGTGAINVVCEEPPAPFDPTAEFRAECEQFYVSDHDNATRVVLNFTDGSSQEFDDIPSDRGQWSYLGSGDNEGKQIDNATIYRNGESVTYEADCPVDEEELSVTFFGCGNVEITGPNELFPLSVNLVTYNQGQGIQVGSEIELDEGERPGSPGGQLIGILTETQGNYINPNWNFSSGSCKDASQGNPAEGIPGDPRDEVNNRNEDSGQQIQVAAQQQNGGTQTSDGEQDPIPSESGTEEGSEEDSTQVWYRDADGDGYGVESDTTEAAEQPEGYVAEAGDCNDENADVNPGATEVPGNEIDENCDGDVATSSTTESTSADTVADDGNNSTTGNESFVSPLSLESASSSSGFSTPLSALTLISTFAVPGLFAYRRER